MIIKLIACPLIGMIIGYFTNWLAVKMLFRPRKEKHIFGRRMPFTPGVIPRGKARLAAAVADVINTKLLTADSIRERLTSAEITSMIRKYVRELLNSLRSDERTIREYIDSLAGEKRVGELLEKLKNFLTEKCTERLKSINLGAIAADMLSTKLYEAFSNSLIIKMFGDSLLASIAPAVEKAVNEYVDEHGEELISRVIGSELDSLTSRQICDLASSTGGDFSIRAEEYALRAYIYFVNEKSGAIMQKFDIGSIAQKAINDMDNEQLETLVLSTMKTELRAIVNLGALIGFLLGLINIAIYFI